MSNYHVIIPAAGKGSRMGRPYNKLFIEVAGRRVLEHTLSVFQSDVQCEGIHLAIHERDRDQLEVLTGPFSKVKSLVVGGETRQDSIHQVLQNVEFTNDDIVLVHDGARPFVTHDTIHEVTAAIRTYGAAIVGVKAKDTIKRVSDQFVTETLDRATLWQVQTPQGATFELLASAYDHAKTQQMMGTDDASLIEAYGQRIYMVEGDYDNIKLTTEEDLTYAEAILEKGVDIIMFRVGLGYDVHAFDATRPLIIGGIEVPHTHGLKGHSDADVLLHAITDAMLGACALGDIGKLFPDTDPQFKDADSKKLLTEAYAEVQKEGYVINNIDATIIAEKPKFRPYIDEMRAIIAGLFAVDIKRVNVKATTSEKLGFTGRQEGIAAQAIVSLTATT